MSRRSWLKVRCLWLVSCVLMWWNTQPPHSLNPDTIPPIYHPAPLDHAPLGLNSHIASRYPDAARMEEAANVVSQTGAGWAREDIQWWRVQPTPDQWDWVFTDLAFAALQQRGVQIVGVIGHPPGWATTFPGDQANQHSFYAPDPAQFARFAQAVAQRYHQQIDHWEIWNEPDHVAFWKPHPDPAAYAQLLIQTSSAIRAVDPQATILIGGINPFDLRFLQTVADSGAWSAFDILAIHPYVDPAGPEEGQIGSAVQVLQPLLARYGAKPLWATEVGWASGPSDRDLVGQTDEQEQAAYLVRSTLLLWQAGVERVFWYSLKDDPDSPYGLYAYGQGRDDFRQPKPALAAFQQLSHTLSQATLRLGVSYGYTTTLPAFDLARQWIRGDRPYARLDPALAPLRHDSALQLRYRFPAQQEQFVAFFAARPLPLPADTQRLGVWVYGDGSANLLRLWLRDAQGEVLQFTLGRVGMPGWQFLSTSLTGIQAEWNRLTPAGDGQLQLPAQLEAFTLVHPEDGLRASGHLFLRGLEASVGDPQYQFDLHQPQQQLTITWSTTNPPPDGCGWHHDPHYTLMPTVQSTPLG